MAMFIHLTDISSALPLLPGHCCKHLEGHTMKLGEIYCIAVDGDRHYEENKQKGETESYTFK